MATSTTGGALYKVGANVIDTSKTDAAIAQRLKDSKIQAERDYQESLREEKRIEDLKKEATQILASRKSGGDDKHKEYITDLYGDAEKFYTTILNKEGGPTYQDLIALDNKIKDNNDFVTWSARQEQVLEEMLQNYDPSLHTVESLENINKYLAMDDPLEQIKNYENLVQLDKRPEYIDLAVFMERNYKNDFVETGRNNQYINEVAMDRAVRDVTTNIINGYNEPTIDPLTNRESGNEDWNRIAEKNPLYNYYTDIKDNKTIAIFDEKKGWMTVKAQDYLNKFSDEEGSLTQDMLLDLDRDGWFLNQMVDNPDFDPKIAESATNSKMVPKKVSERDYREYVLLRDKIYNDYKDVQKPNRKVTKTSSTDPGEVDSAKSGPGKLYVGYKDSTGTKVGDEIEDLSYSSQTDYNTKHGTGGSVPTFTVQNYYMPRTRKSYVGNQEFTPTSNIHVYTDIAVADKDITIDGKLIKKGSPIGDSLIESGSLKEGTDFSKKDIAYFKATVNGRKDQVVYVPADEIEGSLSIMTGKKIDYK